ncbi:MAG: ribonuclease R [Bacteroidota bacterium]
MKSNKKKRPGKRKKKNQDLKNEILNLLKRTPKKRYHARQIIKKLRLSVSADAVDAHLLALEKEGKAILLKNGKFRFNKNVPTGKEDRFTAEGIVDVARQGFAFITDTGLDTDIFIPARKLNYALHGDRVKVQYSLKSRGFRPEGKVIEVLKRAADHFIGTINVSQKFAFVIPDNQRLSVDIFVPLSDTEGAKNGEKVVVRIMEWHGKKRKSPIGKVTHVLGESGSSDIEMKSILLQQGFNLEFPEEVIAESEGLNDKITENEVTKRRDFRAVTTFTIDPDTAKDFDDALSIQYLENGDCEVGVHIADVTHYVKENSALDKEAYKRSTSVYLVDRVLPMLPEKLSNNLCSLRPNEDKFTFSAVFTFNKDDQVVKRWFGKTLIHSDRRFTYEEAQEILETGEGEYASELKKLNLLAKKLRNNRFKKGGISFVSPEVKFKLDEAGRPIEVFIKESKDAHKLIEDFMLLANREVATFIFKKKEGKPVPFVYRIHDHPDEVKVADFAAFAREMGFIMHIDTPGQISKAYNALTRQAETQPELKMLLPLAIRTMAKAVYSTDNIGHYGLSFDYYTHFTSPIRRYSDVLVHRILEKNLKTIYLVSEDELEAQCQHISVQERKAMEAERESVRYKQVEYLESHIGSLYEGIISGMNERGIFVELIENWCEGFVGFETMQESFTLEGRYKAIGNRTGQVYKMGDKVQVRIASVDFAKRKVFMEFIEEPFNTADS